MLNTRGPSTVLDVPVTRLFNVHGEAEGTRTYVRVCAFWGVLQRAEWTPPNQRGRGHRRSATVGVSLDNSTWQA
jgi:hypothetical protein